jgi:magnesium-dependent phosphatase-1
LNLSLKIPIIASKCNEPNWAHECLDKFELANGVKLRTVFDPELIEIYAGNKKEHLKAIEKKSGVKLADMIFFDNQIDNCHVVANIGVTVSYVPDGVTRDAFNRVLASFPAPGQIIK